MADADWENDDFEPQVFKKTDDRWEGEDEDEDVKDNWDDEDEEEDSKDTDKPPQSVVAMQPKKKRPITAIIAEKEEKKRKELEEKRKLAEKKTDEEEEEDPSPEEVLARKLEQQKLQEESDLELAKETFGSVGVTESDSIDHLNPSTKEEFDTFRKALIGKISKYESSVHYAAFLEDFCRELCLNLQPDDTKKISSSLTALATEKLKAQKTAKSKKKSSKKVSLNIGRDDLAIIDYGDEYDDYI